MKRFLAAIAACFLLSATACSSSTGKRSYKIAVVPARRGQHGIFVLNSDTSGSKLVTADLNVQLRPSSWSPDGKRIAFLSYRTGDRSKVPTDFPLYVMDAGGGNQKRLLDFTVSDFGWSPDCRKIFFISAFEDPETDDPDILSGKKSASSAIYILDLNTGQRDRVTSLGKNSSAAWSPDGTRLAFSSGDNSETNVYVASVDGKHVRRLTDSQALYYHPSWSPDGRSIAYLAVPLPGVVDQESGVYITGPEGGDKKRVSDLMCYDVSWSPDGRMLLLQTAAGIYLVSLEKGDSYKVPVGTDRPMDAVFTPDGQRIMYRSNQDGEWYLYSVGLKGEDRRRVIGQLSAASFCLSPLPAREAVKR